MRGLGAVLLRWVAERLIARCKRTPYFHLFHADRSPYMGRYWLLPPWLLEWSDSECSLVPKPWLPIAPRLHLICTPDLDRHLHDHPKSFLSLVLNGWYVEQRPVAVEPCFRGGDAEHCYMIRREAGSLAFRRVTDRHRITEVSPGGVLTLFIFMGPKRHWWGFYTEHGKVHWREYESVHNNAPVTERG